MFLSNAANENYLVSLIPPITMLVEWSQHTLTESQRALAIAISNTAGGDNTDAIVLTHLLVRQDLATNENYGISTSAIEYSDTIVPNIVSATVDYDSGTIVILVDETVDCTQKSKVSPAYNHNESNVSPYVNVPISGGEVVQFDSTSVTITMTELQRSLAIALSGTRGGCGPVVLDADPNALVDIAQNTILQTSAVSVTVSPDFRHPNITAAAPAGDRCIDIKRR